MAMTSLNMHAFILATIVIQSKIGKCRYRRKRIDALLKEHIERMSHATHSKIVLKANKDLVGEFLPRNNSDLHQLFSLEEFEPVFYHCKELNSPHL